MNNIFFENEEDYNKVIKILEDNGIKDIYKNYDIYKAVCVEEAKRTLALMIDEDDYEEPVDNMIDALASDIYNNSLAFNSVINIAEETWAEITSREFDKKEI